MKNKLKDNLLAAAASAAVIAVVVLLNVVLYSLTAINGWYVAYAEELDLTISGRTDPLFEDAIAKGRKVEIIFCMPEDELAVHATGKDVLNTARQFKERYPALLDLTFYNIRTMQDADGNIVADKFEKYQTGALGEKIALHQGAVIFSSTVKDEAGNEREDFTVLNAIYGGVPFVDFYHIDAEGYITAYNGEEMITSMMLWALAPEHKIAYFTKGHDEPVDPTFVKMLLCAGYYIAELDLVRTDTYRSSTLDPEALKNKKGLDLDRAGLVIISNPAYDFAKGASGVRAEIDKLEEYLASGGSLYVSLDPYVGRLPNLENFLEQYGIKMTEGETDEGATVKNIIRDPRNAITTDGYTFVANYADNELGEALSKNTAPFVSDDVVVKNVGALTLSGDAKPVLVSSSAAQAVAGGSQVDSEGSYCVAALSKKAFGDNTANVFVCAGVYLAASDAVISDSYANRNFIYAVLDEFFGSSAAPYGCKIVPYNSGILEDLTMGTARIYTVLIMAIPAGLAVLGIVVNKRRKNR